MYVSVSEDALQAFCSETIDEQVDLRIHPDDEMFQFFYWGQNQDLDTAGIMYLSSGRELWATLRAVLAWHFGDLSAIGRLLDFASGYGRLTRFMVRDVPASQIWIAEIQAGALSQQREQFGVNLLQSTSTPADFEVDCRFDAIVASSLFTHLPEESFAAWLQKIGSLVAPGGILAFSVHDLSLSAEAPEGDFLFRAESESSRLPKDQYGSCWVSESGVNRLVHQALGNWSLLRMPRGLGAMQDLYIAMPEPKADFGSLRLPRRLDSFVEHAEWQSDRRIRVSGWVVDRQGGEEPSEISLKVGNRTVVSVRRDQLQARSEVRAVLGSDSPLACGFDLQADLAYAENAEARCEICCQVGNETVNLYGGTLDSLLLRGALMAKFLLRRRSESELVSLRTERAKLEAELSEKRQLATRLQGQIDWMKASRFWRLREAWWSLRRRFFAR